MITYRNIVFCDQCSIDRNIFIVTKIKKVSNEPLEFVDKSKYTALCNRFILVTDARN